MRIRRSSEFTGAFTMIEIAIAVGVIGFAMVAIIGILPTGMNAQKDNREDTIIAQDAPYFINAIRNGEMRTNNCVLTNFVEEIYVSNLYAETPNASPVLTLFSNYNAGIDSKSANTNLNSDLAIVGWLTTPETDFRSYPGTSGPPFAAPPVGPNYTNIVTAIVRAMSGSPLQQRGANSITAFRYQMTVEILPWNFNSFSNYTENVNNPPNPVNLTQMNYLSENLYELRLRFAWPVHLLPDGTVQTVGPGRQTYRTLICSHLTNENNFWFFQPQTFSSNTNQ